jgi:hypothetical protein
VGSLGAPLRGSERGERGRFFEAPAYHANRERLMVLVAFLVFCVNLG